MTLREGQTPAEELTQIIQIGVVVADVDKSIEGMRHVYGLEPDLVREMKYPELRYRGQQEDSWMRIASYNHFGVRIEFMEPLGPGASMLKDFLKESPYGHALHHIRFNDVDDNDAITAMMAERGVEVYQEGKPIMNPDGKFTFYDALPQLGFVTEVVTKAKKRDAV